MLEVVSFSDYRFWALAADEGNSGAWTRTRIRFCFEPGEGEWFATAP